METTQAVDEHFMRLALQQAQRAYNLGDVPVGAVVVYQGVVLAQACNRTFANHDPAGHAEVVALQQAAQLQQSPRIPGCTLYVTLEPCCMCVGALIQARVDRLVYAVDEPKTGAVRSAFELATSPQHNHHFQITAGVLAVDSRHIIQTFFAERRKKSAARYK